MSPEHISPPFHIRKLTGIASIVTAAVLFAACASAPQPPTPTPPPFASGCGEGEAAETIWPQLSEIQPPQAAPGEAITVMGSGGYVRCGESGYNESARSFALFFDGAPAGQIGCYVNHCQVDLIVPQNAAPGRHTLMAEGGSELTVEIVEP